MLSLSPKINSIVSIMLSLTPKIKMSNILCLISHIKFEGYLFIYEESCKLELHLFSRKRNASVISQQETIFVEVGQYVLISSQYLLTLVYKKS